MYVSFYFKIDCNSQSNDTYRTDLYIITSNQLVETFSNPGMNVGLNGQILTSDSNSHVRRPSCFFYLMLASYCRAICCKHCG